MGDLINNKHITLDMLITIHSDPVRGLLSCANSKHFTHEGILALAEYMEGVGDWDEDCYESVLWDFEEFSSVNEALEDLGFNSVEDLENTRVVLYAKNGSVLVD